MRPTSPPEEDNTTFSARLRRYRIGKDLTILEASKLHDVNARTWAGWETRNRQPKDFHLCREIYRALESFEKIQKKK